MTEDEEQKVEAAKKRLRGFALHLLAYFLVMAALVAVNVLNTPESTWSLYPVVAWGSALALHAAYVMGLFGSPAPKEK